MELAPSVPSQLLSLLIPLRLVIVPPVPRENPGSSFVSLFFPHLNQTPLSWVHVLLYSLSCPFNCTLWTPILRRESLPSQSIFSPEWKPGFPTSTVVSNRGHCCFYFKAKFSLSALEPSWLFQTIFYAALAPHNCLHPVFHILLFTISRSPWLTSASL